VLGKEQSLCWLLICGVFFLSPRREGERKKKKMLERRGERLRQQFKKKKKSVKQNLMLVMVKLQYLL